MFEAQLTQIIKYARVERHNGNIWFDLMLSMVIDQFRVIEQEVVEMGLRKCAHTDCQSLVQGCRTWRVQSVGALWARRIRFEQIPELRFIQSSNCE